MRNITNTRTVPMKHNVKLCTEDTEFLIDKLFNADPQEYFGIIQDIYRHGYEDGHLRGRKNGKIIKLVQV